MSYSIQAGERGLCIGQSGCGKSTLGSDLIKRFLIEFERGVVVLIDSKPRFRATHNLNGFPTRYKNWVDGDVVGGSIAVHSVSEMRQALRFTRCVILQSMYQDGRPVNDFEEQAANCAQELFRRSGKSTPTLYYIDEYYDILYGGLAGLADRRILRVLRAGRERNMAALICTQRPKSIPLPTLTEATKFYIFNLEYDEDIKYLRKHGPRLLKWPIGFQFVFFERMRGGQRIEKLAQLDLRQKTQQKVA